MHGEVTMKRDVIEFDGFLENYIMEINYEFIREMYNIRSKVVHGDIESIKRKHKKRKLSSDYIRLKVNCKRCSDKNFWKRQKDIGEKTKWRSY